MKFGVVQKSKFETIQGAYSIVTERENFDSQITLTDYESELVLSHFKHENIHVGNVQSNRELSSKSFYHYPTGKEIKLNVVFPKPEKKELRLYISSNAGFKPESNDIWFMFIKDQKLWIGSMDEVSWRSESSIFKQDDYDEIYQNSVNDISEIRISRIKSRDVFGRDRNIAVQRMELAKFKCEFDPSHNLFISRFSNKPYLEAHHLIPMGLQTNYTKPLDIIHNIYCLCPYCHRAVHHAAEHQAREIVKTLALKRDFLSDFNLNINDLFCYYSIEEIIK